MPQQRGRPTARIALLHRLQRAGTAHYLTDKEAALLGIRVTAHTSEGRRELKKTLRPLLDSNDPAAREDAERALQFLAVRELSWSAVQALVRAFQVTCDECGKRFLPRGRRRRKNVRAFCDDCAPKAKREADRLRIARKRRAEGQSTARHKV